MENYSKQIREKAKKNIEDAGNFLRYFGVDSSLKYELFIESLKCNDDKDLINQFKQFSLISEQKYKETDVFKITIFIQGYTDFYIMNRFHNKIEKNDSVFMNIDYKSVEKFYDDVDLYTVVLKSMEEFTNLSAYNKIFLMKSLTKEETEMLKSINPFFEFEKNKYDIEITEEFILKQISKWNNSLGLEKALKETINFIFNIYELEPSNLNTLLEQLNIEGEKVAIEDEIINYNDAYITREMLSEKLKEVYDVKEKIKNRS